MADPLYYVNGYPVTRLKNMSVAPKNVRVPGRHVIAEQQAACATRLPHIYDVSDGNGTHYLRKRWETESAPAIVPLWRTFDLSYGGIAGTASPMRIAEQYKTPGVSDVAFFSRGL
jgi:hypothetical protein